MFCVCLRQICGSYFYMIYMKISDEGLWELCLKGDMRAFRELYCRFYALLRNYGIKLLPDKSLVEDCVQDIFIKLIQNHETLSPTVNVKGYLLKTLRHSCMIRSRKTGRWRTSLFMRILSKQMNYFLVSHWIRRKRTNGLNS